MCLVKGTSLNILKAETREFIPWLLIMYASGRMRRGEGLGCEEEGGGERKVRKKGLGGEREKGRGRRRN